ncbi:MAG: hypothetical protein EOO40_00615 [Deltaproteobacteria bacterium]|nr:MAG: hypothetical protein EOO40_00615 [Deltaproteobacteria bacterium]
MAHDVTQRSQRVEAILCAQLLWFRQMQMACFVGVQPRHTLAKGAPGAAGVRLRADNAIKRQPYSSQRHRIGLWVPAKADDNNLCAVVTH